MAKYHVSPQTGDATVCKATKQCPFGPADEHFDSLDEANDTLDEIYSAFNRGYVPAENEAEFDKKLYEGFLRSVEYDDYSYGQPYSVASWMARTGGNFKVVEPVEEPLPEDSRERFHAKLDRAAFRRTDVTLDLGEDEYGETITVIVGAKRNRAWVSAQVGDKMLYDGEPQDVNSGAEMFDFIDGAVNEAWHAAEE